MHPFPISFLHVGNYGSVACYSANDLVAQKVGGAGLRPSVEGVVSAETWEDLHRRNRS